jgi:hypothetical protein
MKALMLGACLAAAVGAPALAQPGDGYQSRPDPYYDQPPPAQAPPPQPAAPQGEGGYQSDQGYGGYQPPPRPPAGQPGFQVYQGGQPYGGYAPNAPAYQPAPRSRSYGGAYFTGQVGRAWRNPEGQVCRWRQLTWQDAYGRQAYQWVPRCRY